MAPQALAAVATLLSFAPHGNRFELRLDRGSAELTWVGASTFRFRRALDGALAPIAPPGQEAVAVQMDDTPGALRMRSKYLEVTIQKHGVLLNVRRLDGPQLLADLSEPKEDGPGVVWERRAPPGVQFYGLGPSTDPEFDLRGKSVAAEYPFLISTAGYAEYHPGAGPFRFDFTGSDRYRVEAPRVDYFFYYGPKPKEIFEEHNSQRGPAATWAASPERPGTWATLAASLLRLVHGAMSADFEPAFDLGAYSGAPADLQARARQLGSLVPRVTPGTLGLSPFRKELSSFFQIYDIEVRDHGHPVWHPLPFQFPDDPECARHSDEFMLGDEMLVAPIYTPGNQRQVYLPQGSWTNLETNQVYPGKSNATVETTALPVFVRNGMIVPLDASGGIGLHYFPKAGGEFFIVESDIGDYTQVHAAPAADIMRLQIESKKERDYQWVVHHLERPANVGFEEQKYRSVPGVAALADRTWYYDAAQKNLIIRVHVKAEEDCIINLEW